MRPCRLMSSPRVRPKSARPAVACFIIVVALFLLPQLVNEVASYCGTELFPLPPPLSVSLPQNKCSWRCHNENVNENKSPLRSVIWQQPEQQQQQVVPQNEDSCMWHTVCCMLHTAEPCSGDGNGTKHSRTCLRSTTIVHFNGLSISLSITRISCHIECGWVVYDAVKLELIS